MRALGCRVRGWAVRGLGSRATAAMKSLFERGFA